MADKLPSILNLTFPAYHTVLFDGVPMWRAQAWALWDYRVHGGHVKVNSAIRSNEVIAKYVGKGLRPGYSSQEYLYANQGKPGFFPANKPTETSHCGYSDGNPAYDKLNGHGVWAPRGAKIELWQFGIDAVDHDGGDAARLVTWLNRNGYKAIRPYTPPSVKERHHFCFLASPAGNARKRLAKYKVTGK